MNNNLTNFLLVSFLLVFVACSSQTPPAATPTATPALTFTPTATPTFTPTPAPKYTAEQVIKIMTEYLDRKVYETEWFQAYGSRVDSEGYVRLSSKPYFCSSFLHNRYAPFYGGEPPRRGFVSLETEYIVDRRAWVTKLGRVEPGMLAISSYVEGYGWVFDEVTGTIASSNPRC